MKDYANYVYDASNRLTAIQNAGGSTLHTLSYDVQGNVTAKDTASYTFDYGNRLRLGTGPGGSEGYRYNGHGRRALAWVPAGATLSFYAFNGQLLYQHSTPKARALDHIYLAGSLVAIREAPFAGGSEVKYQHTDALGSPVAISNAAGTVTERTNYDPYGGAINKTVDGVGYTGHVMDPATGLTYMQQRYYDPVVGRFLSVDPVTASKADGGNFNRYWYANNSPYMFTDPDGRFGTKVPVCEIRSVYVPRGPTVVLPTATGIVTSDFSPARTHPNSGVVRAHLGTDFKAGLGEPIMSTQNGKVEAVRSGGDGGNRIRIQNEDGSLSSYMHTAPADGIKERVDVVAGQTIGTSDGSGNISGAHLHYEYRPGTVEAPATQATPPVDPVKTQLKGKL